MRTVQQSLQITEASMPSQNYPAGHQNYRKPLSTLEY